MNRRAAAIAMVLQLVGFGILTGVSFWVDAILGWSAVGLGLIAGGHMIERLTR